MATSLAKGPGGTNASFIVLADGLAPDVHSFKIGDDATTLEVQEDGTVAVFDAEGVQIDYVMAPWAKDANGVDLRAYYSTEGNVLTQYIETEGATFPVVADPTTGCGVGWCSVYFIRSETNAIADGGAVALSTIAAGCTAIGGVPAGAACTAISAPGIAVALGANANGNCVGIIGYGVPGTRHCTQLMGPIR